MADFPKIMPYVIEEIVSSDSFYTNYRAINSDLEEERVYTITEFNPSFMVTRTENGALEPTERFIIEYETALDRFTKFAETLENLGEPFIAPIVQTLELNNTMYVVRLSDRPYRALSEGMGTTRRDFNDAYVILRPLLQSLVTAYKRNLFFQFLPGSVRVNSYGQLILDSMFSWEINHRHTIFEIGKLFYQLIAGVEYNPSIAENPTVDDLSLPPRLTATLKEVLSNEAAYGSIEDFSRQLRTVMDIEGNKEIILDRPLGPARTAEAATVKKGAAAGVLTAVAIAAVLLVGAPLAWIFGPNLFSGNEDNINGTPAAYNDEDTADIINEPVIPVVFVRTHTAYAITDPNDPAIMLNGSFYESGGTVFQSIYQNGFALSQDANVIVRGVRPAFITSHGDFIYFSDGFSDYNIRRVRRDGSGLETISNHTASFLLIDGNYLFYTNHSDRDFLYRMNLTTLQSSPFLQLAAYETAVHAGQLFFINGSGGFRIYSLPLDEPGASPIRINDANSDNLRVAGGHIFYRNVEDNTISRITPDGTPTAFTVPLQAASFDISGQNMAVLEAGSNQLWFFNISSHDLIPTGHFASYVMAQAGNMAHFIDVSDSRVTRRLS